MSLPAYTRTAAVVFVLFGAAGFAAGFLGYSGFLGPGLPENGMHVGVGLLFAYFGFSRSPHADDRYFVGGMGVLLLLGKAGLMGGNVLGPQHLLSSVTEVLCVVAGASSILAARYLPDGRVRTPSRSRDPEQSNGRAAVTGLVVRGVGSSVQCGLDPREDERREAC